MDRRKVENRLRQLADTAKIADFILTLPIKLGIFLAFVGGIVTGILALLGERGVLFLLTSIVAIVASIATLLLIRSQKEKIDEQPQKENEKYEYEYIYREATYKYLPQSDRRLMQMNERVKARVMKEGLTSWLGRYRWKTHGKVRISTPTPNYRIVENIEVAASPYEHYRVVFDRVPKKGETVEFEVHFDLTDEAGVAPLWFLAEMKEPTERLLLRVILPLDDPPTQTELRHYENRDAEKPIEIKTGHFDRYAGEIRLEETDPKLGHCYGIFWSWPQVPMDS